MISCEMVLLYFFSPSTRLSRVQLVVDRPNRRGDAENTTDERAGQYSCKKVFFAALKGVLRMSLWKSGGLLLTVFRIASAQLRREGRENAMLVEMQPSLLPGEHGRERVDQPYLSLSPESFSQLAIFCAWLLLALPPLAIEILFRGRGEGKRYMML
jgi:hypothetical protein